MLSARLAHLGVIISLMPSMAQQVGLFCSISFFFYITCIKCQRAERRSFLEPSWSLCWRLKINVLLLGYFFKNILLLQTHRSCCLRSLSCLPVQVFPSPAWPSDTESDVCSLQTNLLQILSPVRDLSNIFPLSGLLSLMELHCQLEWNQHYCF